MVFTLHVKVAKITDEKYQRARTGHPVYATGQLLAAFAPLLRQLDCGVCQEYPPAARSRARSAVVAVGATPATPPREKQIHAAGRQVCAPGASLRPLRSQAPIEAALCGEAHRCPVINSRGHHPPSPPEQLGCTWLARGGDTPVDAVNLIPA